MACLIRSQPGVMVRTVAGGLLVQDRDIGRITAADLKIVTEAPAQRRRKSRT